MKWTLQYVILKKDIKDFDSTNQILNELWSNTYTR